MLRFCNDYSEGAHPLVLKALTENCYEQNGGYGEDPHSKNASDLIRSYIGESIDVDIHFLPGGTITNMTVLHAMMRPFDAVIALETGHISTHETGAIEGLGHKVIAVSGEDGKMLPEDIIAACKSHYSEHMVHPAVVYISNTTEMGSVYTKEELEKIKAVCREFGLYLYMDGARLGSALTSKYNDLTLRDIAWLTDAFTIGGTKNGALFGEAVVISNSAVQRDFRSYMKHQGALTAKGFTLGMQFEALFTDRLYFRLAEHANRMAYEIAEACRKAGFPFLTRPVSNQIFVVVPNEVAKNLSHRVIFEPWERADEDHMIIRFVASWATRDEQIEELKEIIKECAM